MPVQSDEGSTSFEHSEDSRNPKRSRSSEAGPTALNPQFSVLLRGDSGASSSQWQPREQYEHQWWRDQGWGRSQWEQDQQEQSSWWRDQWSNQSWQWQQDSGVAASGNKTSRNNHHGGEINGPINHGNG